MRLYAVKCVVILAACAMALPPLLGQKADESASRSKILALEHVWDQAESARDLKALDELFDNALTYVEFDGTVMTKAEFLSRVKSAPPHQVTTESMTVEIFGNAAIVTGIYHSSERKGAAPLLRRGRFIDTWVLKGSTWVCVAAQSTLILH